MTHPNPFPRAKVLFFDLMGTCCDWHTTILTQLHTLPPCTNLPQSEFPAFALEWRAGFFEEIHTRFMRCEEQEDIDITHRRVLDSLLVEKGASAQEWGEREREILVRGWHTQTAWPDVKKGLERLKEKFEVIVLANGTTRLQLDIVRSAGLEFDILFSSQLLALTKPDPQIYRKAAELVGCSIENGECIMVAAHAYDLRAARGVGMGTVYIRRETEDAGEDFEKVKGEVDLFLDGSDGSDGSDRSDGCGLGLLADVLGC